MSKQTKKTDGASLGLDGVVESHPIAEAVAEIEHGLQALRKALMTQATLRAGDAADGLRTRLLDAEASIEKLIAQVPGVGPTLAMGLYRATHSEDVEASGENLRPSNVDDMSKQIEPGGVASSEYLEHVGLA